MYSFTEGLSKSKHLEYPHGNRAIAFVGTVIRASERQVNRYNGA